MWQKGKSLEKKEGHKSRNAVVLETESDTSQHAANRQEPRPFNCWELNWVSNLEFECTVFTHLSERTQPAGNLTLILWIWDQRNQLSQLELPTNRNRSWFTSYSVWDDRSAASTAKTGGTSMTGDSVRPVFSHCSHRSCKPLLSEHSQDRGRITFCPSVYLWCLVPPLARGTDMLDSS